MLQELRVVDLALLAQAQLEFGAGLTVLTGETGDGKSLVLGAISLLAGARSRQGLVRSGAAQAVLEGRFVLDAALAAQLAEQCDLIDASARELVLRRVVLPDGSSRAYLDGKLCTVGTLAKLGQHLLAFHGQDEHLLLHNATRQAELLDAFAGLQDAGAQWRTQRRELQDTDARCRELRSSMDQRGAREAWLLQMCDELRGAGVEQGEEQRLREEHRLQSGGQALAADLDGARSLLSDGDEALADALARSARQLRARAAGHAGIEEVVLRMDSLETECRDLARSCGNLLDQISLDPEGLMVIEQRLDLLRTLARKHRVDANELGAHLAACEAELAALGEGDDTLARLETARAQCADALRSLARTMLAKRKSAAKRLAQVVETVLGELRMQQAQLSITIEPASIGAEFDALAAPPHGPGPVQFLLAANAGEAAHPLERVASGGETARVLLAIETALAKVIPVPLLVFDEIDAGVGGRVGAALGRHLAALAAGRQVIAVTHLPQVAAYAQAHWRVSKHTQAGRTVTKVEALESEARVQELAAMLGGDASGNAARAQAKALLAEARA